MSGLSSIVKPKDDNSNADQDDPFEGIDIQLPQDVDEVMKSDTLNSGINAEEEGDKPPPELFDQLEGQPQSPKYAGDTNIFKNEIRASDSSFEEYVQSVLQHGADKGVVNVVVGHCNTGMSKEHGQIIIAGAMQYGFGKNEALELCNASLNGANEAELKDLISNQLANNKSYSSKGNFTGGDLIKSILGGFVGLFSMQRSGNYNKEINSKNFDRALESVHSSAIEICKTSFSHNIAAAKDSISSPEDLKKFVSSMKMDDESKEYVDDYRSKVEALKKEAKSLMGKAKSKEQAESIHSKITDAIDDLNSQYKDRLEFINDSARSPIAEFIDELGKEIDKMFQQIKERFGIRSKKAEVKEDSPAETATNSPSAS